ncbi:MAG: hemerythrin domain-containing protein [Salaquimonas sp.]
MSNKKLNEGCAQGNASWLNELDYHFQSQLGLCNALEKIADALPANVDKQECLYVARSIYPVVKSAHEYEEKTVFPNLQQMDNTSFEYNTLDRLHAEHWEDESYAEEIQDALIQFVIHPDVSNPDTLGYMLRGFFEGMRRHIAFEQNFFPQCLNPSIS